MAATRLRLGPGPLIVMVGGIASGKSHAARHIATEILGDPQALIATDDLRAQIFGNPEVQGDPGRIHGIATEMTKLRLEAGLGTIYDATSLLPRDRASLVALATATGAPLVAVWADATPEMMTERNASRSRRVPDAVVQKMAARAAQVTAPALEKEGFKVFRLTATDLESTGALATALASLEVVPSGWNRDSLSGPFDIVGDVHGCFHTLQTLMTELGYAPDGSHPEGRTLAFVGDIVDRGANTWQAWGLVSDLHRSGRAHLVKGNHEAKHARYLQKMATAPDPSQVVEALAESQGAAHGLTAALAQSLESGTPAEWASRAVEMERLPSHISLDAGRLLICHGAARPDLIGRAAPGDREAESWFLFGAPTGARTPEGFPVRADFQPDWDGSAFVVVGHSTVAAPRFLGAGGGSINIDTGAAFGPNGSDVHTGARFAGRLTALRYEPGFSPTAETVSEALVSVPTDPRDLSQ